MHIINEVLNHLDREDAPSDTIRRLENYQRSNLLSKMTGRDAMLEIADEFQNNYLTVDCFARCNHLTNEQAIALLELARNIRNSNNPHH